MKSDLVIETPRLLLRPIDDGDADEWWQAIWSDAEVTRYLPPRKPIPRSAMPLRMQRTAEHWQAHGVGFWSVREKGQGVLVGHCGLVVNEPPDVELVYALARSAWGRGFATEAAGAMVTRGFETHGLDRLFALVFPENTASTRVLDKLGFTFHDQVARFGTDLLRYIRVRDWAD